MFKKHAIGKAIFCIMVIFVVCFSIYNHEIHKFTCEKWALYPDKRYLMVEDLLADYVFVGMSEQDVISLLGEETNGSQQSSFKGDHTYYDPEETLVYYIGTDMLEGRWLILSIEEQKVVSISFGVT